jgi:hypothetical protein
VVTALGRCLPNVGADAREATNPRHACEQHPPRKVRPSSTLSRGSRHAPTAGCQACWLLPALKDGDSRVTPGFLFRWSLRTGCPAASDVSCAGIAVAGYGSTSRKDVLRGVDVSWRAPQPGHVQ